LRRKNWFGAIRFAIAPYERYIVHIKLWRFGVHVRYFHQHSYLQTMWEFVQELFTSKSPWSGLFFLISGAILGAATGTILTIRAQRPKLIVSGHGEGGNQQSRTWSLTIANQPSFLGFRLAGETASDLRASLEPRGRGRSVSQVLWSGHANVNIEAGKSQSIQLFYWFAEERGRYFLLDENGQRSIAFESPEQKFELRVGDRLGRLTKFVLTVRFDDLHLQRPPQLDILYPIYFGRRIHMIKFSLMRIYRALLPNR
jgi:hypothetical protein